MSTALSTSDQTPHTSKEPLYKRPMFWLVVIAHVIGVLGALLYASNALLQDTEPQEQNQ